MNYPIPLVAWTGGDRPPEGFNDPIFLKMRAMLYREQFKLFQEYAGESPDEDLRSIYLLRAKYDAWRSYTEWKGKQNG